MIRLDQILTTGMLIKIMGGIGSIWILFVLVSASQSGGAAALRADNSVRPPKGFELAFPPRPLPSMPLAGRDGETTLKKIGGSRLVVQYSPARCPDCSSAKEALLTLADNISDDRISFVIVETPSNRAQTPDSLVDIGNSVPAYIGRNTTEPVTVLYDVEASCEIGRVQGLVDWASEPVKRFVEASLTERGCR